MTGDTDRFPVLGEAGRAMLDFLREHPSAPIFRNMNAGMPSMIPSARRGGKRCSARLPKV